jgi:uncharacterized protein (TIGR00725 family)
VAAESKIISVFGSSLPQAGETEYEYARQLGQALATRGFDVCTGGYGGVMEAALRGAKEAGGRTLAVTSRHFRKACNGWADREVRVENWRERLFELVRLGHGYVACRGGTGTLVELAVVWEMLNKGLISGKPLVAFGNFWTPVVERVREVELPGESNQHLVTVIANADEVAHFMARAFGYIAG